MDDVVTYLLNFAMKHKIGFLTQPNWNENWPSVSIPERRFMIINLNWRNQRELPFQIAHEISHILNDDEGILYYTTSNSKSQIECGANESAIQILIDYCDKLGLEHYNIIKFMDVFGIPANLEYMVVDKLENRFEI